MASHIDCDSICTRTDLQRGGDRVMIRRPVAVVAGAYDGRCGWCELGRVEDEIDPAAFGSAFPAAERGFVGLALWMNECDSCRQVDGLLHLFRRAARRPPLNSLLRSGRPSRSSAGLLPNRPGARGLAPLTCDARLRRCGPSAC